MKFLFNSSLVKNKEVSKIAHKLISYISSLARVEGYHSPEGFLNLPRDKKFLREVLEVKEEKLNKGLKYIIVVGIGGSDLGTKAVYDAIFGYSDLLNKKRFPKMFFLETNDPESLKSLSKFLRKEIKKPSEVLVNVISKSGETTETVANFEFIFRVLKARFKKNEERIVVTTDFGSKLYTLALENGIETLTVPSRIGGRFSVFSAVGLFPLAACGLDVKKLLEGARKANIDSLKSKNNPALTSAAVIYKNLRRGKIIHDSFFFHPELESLGKWYRQLVSESLGKKRMAITPTVSVGSTDLHSIGQLYLGGPKNKLTTFIYTKAHRGKALAKKRAFPELVKELKGKSAEEIMVAIFQGVKSAYKKRGLPFIEVELKDISPESLGEFMEFKMLETVFLGKLLGVNAFDQPAVQLYKKETRRMLRGKK